MNMEYSKSKYGVLITTYNRTGYVENTLFDLYHKTPSEIANNTFFLIIDDGSKDQKKINQLFNQFNVENKYLIKKPKNKGITSSVLMGFDILYNLNVDYIMNIDSDVNLKKNWICDILNLNEIINKKKNLIINGWYFPNLEKIENKKNYVLTKWMSGLFTFFHSSFYTSFRNKLFQEVEYCTINNYEIFFDKDIKINSKYNQKHWDVALSEIFNEEDKYFYCPYPPSMEHVGRVGKNTRLNYDVIKNDFDEYDYLI